MASLFKGRTVAQGAEDLAQGAEDLAVTAAVEDNDEVGGMAATRPAAIARSSGAAGMQWRNGGPAAPQEELVVDDVVLLAGQRCASGAAARHVEQRRSRGVRGTESSGQRARRARARRDGAGKRGERSREQPAANGAESSRRRRSQSIGNTTGATVPERIDVFSDRAPVVISGGSVAGADGELRS
jgi:hypothetical protein